MALQEEFEQQGLWLFRYRSTLPLVLLVVGFWVYMQGVYSGSDASLNNQYCITTTYRVYYEALCLLVSLAGLVIRIYTVGYTPANTSGRNTAEQVADTVNTTGIYSTVRHPLYLGNFFMWVGPALLSANPWFILSFCLVYWLYYERIMFAEEQFLRGKFGEQYTQWAARVPAFIPSLGNFQKPSLPFSVRKVLKKEKNGLAATFFIFSLFDVSREYALGTHNYNTALHAATVLSILLYIILRYLKNNTRVLDEEGR